MVREHHVRLKIQGDRPITITEVRIFLPTAESLKIDHSTRAGLFVFDANRQPIGYAARTAPKANHITGYSGPTDTLMIFDPGEKLVGIEIRHSYDTPSHVKDVVDAVRYSNSNSIRHRPNRSMPIFTAPPALRP